MTRDKPDTVAPEELLAAYADGGLDADEAARVEAYLAEDPASQRELGELREVLDSARELAPRPVTEPNWAAMAAGIRRACDDEARAREQGWLARLQGWFSGLLRPRYAIGFAAAAVAAAVLILVLQRGTAPDSQIAEDLPTEQDESLTLDPHDLEPDLFGVDGDVDSVADNALDDLLDDLDRGVFEASDDDEGLDEEIDALFDDALLPDDAIAEWTGAADSDGEYGAGIDDEMFGEPDYDVWLDGLSDDDLDSLDAFLTETQAG